VLSYFFSFLALGFLVFLPDQKAEAQTRKKTWSSSEWYGRISVGTLCFALCYSVGINLLSMFESTMCLKIAGGDGCEVAAVVNATNATAAGDSASLLRRLVAMRAN
jgi:hypothetical protein